MLLKQALLTTFWYTLKKQVLDTLFPIFCLGCEKKGVWICQACKQSITVRLEQHCPFCNHAITPAGQICFQCRDSLTPALDGLFVASYYHDTLLPHAIHTWKYRFIAGIAKPLGQFLVTTLQRSAVSLPDIILPVPLHQRRLRFRGFNQSELLAEELANTLTPGLPIPILTNVLIRTRYTRPQMKTDSREERIINLTNAFTITDNQEETIKGKYIWLIDDVATTGTTLEECARILKQHGAHSVWGIVLAR